MVLRSSVDLVNKRNQDEWEDYNCWQKAASRTALMCKCSPHKEHANENALQEIATIKIGMLLTILHYFLM